MSHFVRHIWECDNCKVRTGVLNVPEGWRTLSFPETGVQMHICNECFIVAEKALMKKRGA